MRPEDSKRKIYNRERPKKPSVERANPFNNHPELLTRVTFLLGNGKSRENFDLERLRGLGTIVGCNAIYRDFAPDILITVDAKMINEVKDCKYYEDHHVIIPANRQATLPKCLTWRTTRFNTSGCFGMKMMNQLIQPDRCYMLGMDGYHGNVYQNTPNYSAQSITDFSNVIKYYVVELSEADGIKYYNVNHKDTWVGAQEQEAYHHISYDEFEKHIKSGFII